MPELLASKSTPLRALRCAEIASVPTLHRDPTVSQLCHAFAAPEGHRRTRDENEGGRTKYRRTPEETAGHRKTRVTQGSGP